MSKVYADAVATPEPTDDLTLGGSGDNVIVTAGATLKTNTVKDSGGNTLFTSDGSGNLSSLNSGLAGNMVLLTTNTSSNAANSSFTSSIDSTYKLYIFKLIDIHARTDDKELGVQFNAASGSGFNETITSTVFRAYQSENASTAVLSYDDSRDQAQGTAYQSLWPAQSSDADSASAGTLWLFNPSNTTYVKHFYTVINNHYVSAHTFNYFVGGYINTTSAIDEVDFKMTSGNFDGVIKMYGVG